MQGPRRLKWHCRRGQSGASLGLSEAARMGTPRPENYFFRGDPAPEMCLENFGSTFRSILLRRQRLLDAYTTETCRVDVAAISALRYRPSFLVGSLRQLQQMCFLSSKDVLNGVDRTSTATKTLSKSSPMVTFEVMQNALRSKIASGFSMSRCPVQLAVVTAAPSSVHE